MGAASRASRGPTCENDVPVPPPRVKVFVRSFESIAIDETVLAFPPPFVASAPNPGAFEHWWKLLQFFFALEDPADFPPLSAPISDTDLQLLQRYVLMAEEMAESGQLNADDVVTIRLPDHGSGSEEVDATFSKNEIARGFTALFRQFDDPNEPASFSRVLKVLSRVNELANDPATVERRARLKAWRVARGRLEGTTLKVLVGQKLRDEGRMPPGIPGEGDMSPMMLISKYQYGEMIHWGDERSVLEAAADDPFARAKLRMDFLHAAVGLTHLYLGFALVVRASLATPVR
jgi:hypothetical protein